MRLLTYALLGLWLSLSMMAEAGPATNSIPTNTTTKAEAVLEVLRDPFWPVGYVPAPPEPDISEAEVARIEVELETKAKTKWPALRLKGISQASRGRYMAIIEGVGLIETGQTVAMQRDGLLYTWIIDEVSAKGVRFTRLKARPYTPPVIGGRTQ